MKNLRTFNLLILLLICQNTYRALYPMGGPAAAAGVASVAAVLGTPLRVLLTAISAVRKGCDLYKNFRGCSQDSSSEARTKSSSNELEMQAKKEEAELTTSLSLRVAQQQMIEKALHLLLIIYNPSTHPCNRIKSLFELNCLKFYGYKARVFHEWLSYINRHHFTTDGSLKSFELPANPKHIRELACFLRALAYDKVAYRAAIKKGIECGIPQLKDYLYKQESFWECIKGLDAWKFTGEIIKKMVGFDLTSLNKVEPETIIQRKTNQAFMKVIGHCEDSQFDDANHLIERHRSKHNGNLCKPYELMRRYCNESQTRI